MIIMIIYGILGTLPLLLMCNTTILITIFNLIFNISKPFDIKLLFNIYVIYICLFIIYQFIFPKKHFKTKINYKIIMFCIFNFFINIILKNRILLLGNLKTVIIELLINIILLFILKKKKIGLNKDNYLFLIILFIFCLITTYFKINNILIIYFLGRMFNINHQTIINYIKAFILSISLAFIIIINYNFNVYILLTSFLTGLYILFIYYKFNYSKLIYIYLISLLLLLFYFR